MVQMHHVMTYMRTLRKRSTSYVSCRLCDVTDDNNSAGHALFVALNIVFSLPNWPQPQQLLTLLFILELPLSRCFCRWCHFNPLQQFPAPRSNSHLYCKAHPLFSPAPLPHPHASAGIPPPPAITAALSSEASSSSSSSSRSVSASPHDDPAARPVHHSDAAAAATQQQQQQLIQTHVIVFSL